MKVKVCGIVAKEQLEELDTIDVDMIGRIFYPSSPRSMQNLERTRTKKPQVGVFVNAETDYIMKQIQIHRFHRVQLHGSESLEQVEILRFNGVEVIKAISLADEFPQAEVEYYSGSVDYFLFDTKGLNPGGNGQAFNWKLLDEYQEKTPFFLSGGIGPGHANAIKKFSHPALFAIDINSGFEIKPGLKDIKKIKTFLNEIQA
ncbi:MAG: phosphoribosylanthranilate isomerase [Flavobacteriales bacterium]|nr:phosphoribosylanthranilate isomerase [Flavobacteriales bacterium]